MHHADCLPLSAAAVSAPCCLPSLMCLVICQPTLRAYGIHVIAESKATERGQLSLCCTSWFQNKKFCTFTKTQMDTTMYARMEESPTIHFACFCLKSM